MFKGSLVALVTPFKDDKIDQGKIEELVEFHIKNNTAGIVPCGTTGESATLSCEEHEKVIELVIKAANKRLPVIAGTGSNNTAEAVTLTKHAEEAGADAVLLVSPYYNKPTQEGLYLHFKTIAKSVNIPVILYNIASRTGINIEPETIARLAEEVKNIAAIKEASGSLEQMSRIVSLCGDRLTLLSGDDSLTLPVLSIGGKGVISVVANIVPADTAKMIADFENKDLESARGLHYKLLPLVKAMFIETNPISVKTAMGLMAMIDSKLRLPLCSMKEENLAKLKKALADYGLIR